METDTLLCTTSNLTRKSDDSDSEELTIGEILEWLQELLSSRPWPMKRMITFHETAIKSQSCSRCLQPILGAYRDRNHRKETTPKKKTLWYYCNSDRHQWLRHCACSPEAQGFVGSISSWVVDGQDTALSPG